MRNDSLWSNYQYLIRQNEEPFVSYFVMKANFSIDSFHFEKLVKFQIIDNFELIINESNKFLKDKVNEIQDFLTNKNDNEKLFIVEIKAFFGLRAGIALHDKEILEDILTICAIYLGSKYSIIGVEKTLIPNTLIESLSKIEEEDKERNNIEIKHNIKRLCDLTEKQFKLIISCFLKIIKSLNYANSDCPIGFVYLVSAIEPFAEIYGNYQNLSQILPQIIKEMAKSVKTNFQITQTRKEIETLLFEVYQQHEFLDLKEKFIGFCSKFVEVQWKNEKLPDLLDDIYYLRSKILHSFEEFDFKRDEIIHFNRFTRRGVLKPIEGEEGRSIIVPVRVVAYDTLFLMLYMAILNFINYLLLEHKSDEGLEAPIYEQERGIIHMQFKKNIVKQPGQVILHQDVEATLDYIHVIQLRNLISETNENYNNMNKRETYDIFLPKFFSFPPDAENKTWLEALFLKIELEYHLKEINALENNFSCYRLDSNNPAHWGAFNIKAYHLMSTNINSAIQIIEHYLEIVQDIRGKMLLEDTYGDLMLAKENYKKAIDSFLKSLRLGEEYGFLEFHKNSIKKANDCVKKLETNEYQSDLIKIEQEIKEKDIGNNSKNNEISLIIPQKKDFEKTDINLGEILSKIGIDSSKNREIYNIIKDGIISKNILNINELFKYVNQKLNEHNYPIDDSDFVLVKKILDVLNSN